MYQDRFSIYYIKAFDLVTLISELVTVFSETKSITKSRLHRTKGKNGIPKRWSCSKRPAVCLRDKTRLSIQSLWLLCEIA